MNWRTQTLDHLIMRGRQRGFNDKDFVGWEDLDGQTRVSIVNQVLHHNGVAQIIFRKSFADAAFVGDKPLRNADGFANYPDVTKDMQTVGDYWRVRILLADDWLLFIRKTREMWDIDLKPEPGLEL